MNTHTDNHESTGAAEDSLARLVRMAGRRQDPPGEVHDQVYAAAAAALRNKIRRRQRRRMGYAVAATVALVAVLIGVLQGGPGRSGDQSPDVALTDLVAGTVQIRGVGDTAWRAIEGPGTALTEGTSIRTAASSGLGLRLANGDSFRLDERTEILFESPTQVHLLAGAVYLDSGHSDGGAAEMEIQTPTGRVRHIGTQFELKYTMDALRLRIREGQVLLTYQTGEVQAHQGDEISVGRDGRLLMSTVDAYGPVWDWVQALAPMPGGDQRSLASLLKWVERETGRKVHFARPDLEQMATETILHGSSRRMLPMEALSVMLETTDFHYTVTGENEILIEESGR